MLRLGYNTSGFAHHRLEDAAEIVSEIGYDSLAVTIERDLLDPPNPGGVGPAAERLNAIRRRTGLSITLETGARFILDPRRKHQPTLISADAAGRARRMAFLAAAIELAAAVEAESVSLWSGAASNGRQGPPAAADDQAPKAEHFARLERGLHELLNHAARHNVRLAFEPEPGMLIDTMERFARLHESVKHELFGLTLDVGHLVCLGEGPIGDHVSRWAGRLWNVHIEDMRPGVHEHLMFGEGEVDFPAMFAALHGAAYAGPVHVELSRHSHDAVNTARRAFEFLRRLA